MFVRKTLFLLITLLMAANAQAQLVQVDKHDYFAVFDINTQVPKQVEWSIHSKDLGNVKRETQWRFLQDVPHVLALASHNDYNRSGYHRGHLCPAADRSSNVQAMRATFAISNVCPQSPAINVGSWKQTENMCRTYAMQYDSVSIIACPVFLHRDTARIGRAPICVPHAFFKAVWVTSTDSVLNAWFIFNE